MDLKDIILIEISKTEKDKYCMISLVVGIETGGTRRRRGDMRSCESRTEPHYTGRESTGDGPQRMSPRPTALLCAFETCYRCSPYKLKW